MKPVLALIIVIGLTLGVKAQSFEGEIVYSNSYKSKIPSLPDDKLRAMMGSKQEYFIKGSRYKSITNGQMFAYQVYDDKSNRLYLRTTISDTLYWLDGATNDDAIVGDYQIKENAETILGNTCNVLVAKTKSGKIEYYYNSRYKVDAAKYAKHQYGNWALLVRATGALPLKMVVENANFRMESTATVIKPQVLSESTFVIDAKMPVKKMK